MELNNPFDTLSELKKEGYYYSLPKLEKAGFSNISRLPRLIRVMIESLLRNFDNKKIKEKDIENLCRWTPKPNLDKEVPFVVSRVLLQDFTGVPLIVDLAAMRDAAARQMTDPANIEPIVPVDLVIDHSVQVDRAATQDAFLFNLQFEFERNQQRYSFLKWGQQAFQSFKVIPPGIGICHQVNLEYLATVVTKKKWKDKVLIFPDTLVGTDSHTTMVNGLGVLGWGVGGIEATAAMLGQAVSFPMPEVIGFHLTGELQEGITATDLTLRITEILRKEKVVGKFVEFFGSGAERLTVADRATIANMTPEYGATCGYFPVDRRTLEYLKATGRQKADIHLVKEYLEAQELFGMPRMGEIDYSKTIELDLSSIDPCVSGPKRPQDRIAIDDLKIKFKEGLEASVANGGYGKSLQNLPKVYLHSQGDFALEDFHQSGGKEVLENEAGSIWSESEMVTNRPFTSPMISPGYSEAKPCETFLTHGSIVIAAITSCTNTSNPSVMVAAGLLAKKAIEKGMRVSPAVKTSLAPGSRVVSDYLENSGLQKYLDQLGFQLVAYGCTTCIGNSGPLDEEIENAIRENDLIAASVLSGNRNFEARVHGSVKANFLMSPPLVVAFALAGRVDIDFKKEPVGYDQKGGPVFLKELWPSNNEIEGVLKKHLESKDFETRYANIENENPLWEEIQTKKGARYSWEESNSYIQNPPYFEEFSLDLPPRPLFKNLRPLAFFGDSVTTDHISPAGAFRASSPAGQYLASLGVAESDFNSYGSRRGNHNVMMRGTFANIRLRNKLADGKEGGYTKLMPDNEVLSIFDASKIYAKRKEKLIIFTGKDYGMGSSRDWAAKGTALLGVEAVVAQSFERIHRSNLIGMGVLPLEFTEESDYDEMNLTGEEIFSLEGLNEELIPNQYATLRIDKNGHSQSIKLRLRLDTPMEVEYYTHGGIMPYVLRQIIQNG